MSIYGAGICVSAGIEQASLRYDVFVPSSRPTKMRVVAVIVAKMYQTLTVAILAQAYLEPPDAGETGWTAIGRPIAIWARSLARVHGR